MHRVKAHTAAGAFATLLVMIPWKVLQARGLDEVRAASVAGVLLGAAAVAALAARGTRLARRAYFMPAFRESFEVSAFLRAFAAYAFALLALGVGLWALRAAGG